MYILYRRVSDYDGPSLFLGLFDSQENAERQRSAYRVVLEQQDPWHNQSYRDVDLDNDLVIIPIDGGLAGQQKGYLISSYSEGFGQIIRQFHQVCSDKLRAEEIAKKLEDDDLSSFPGWALVDEVAVNQFVIPDYDKWQGGCYEGLAI